MGSETHVAAILHSAAGERDPSIGDELRAALGDAAASDDVASVRREIAALLGEITAPIGAGMVGVWLGAGVEGGSDPEETMAPLAAAMSKWCQVLAQSADEETARGVQYLGQGLVAHLVRDRPGRDALAADSSFIESLDAAEDLSPGPVWVLRVLRQASGDLVMIHVDGRLAAEVHFENVEWNFELFSLLQEQLARVFPDARHPFDGNKAWWHYGRCDVPTADITGSIWGEQSPTAIPTVDGVAVVLLWKPILATRSWSGFSGPTIEAAPPTLTVTRSLAPDELDHWWKRLRLPSPA